MKRESRLAVLFVSALLIVNILTVEAEYCDDEVNNLLTAKLETSDNKLDAITEAARIELQKTSPSHLTDCARDLFKRMSDLAIFNGGSTIECTSDEMTILNEIHSAMRKDLLTYSILEIDPTNKVVYPIVSLQKRFMKQCFKVIEEELVSRVIKEPTRLIAKMFEQFMQITTKPGDLSYLGVVAGLIDKARVIVRPQKNIELWAKMMRGLFNTKHELEKKLTSDKSFKVIGWDIGEKSLFDKLINSCKKNIKICPRTIKKLYTSLIWKPCKYLLDSYSRIELLEEAAYVAAVSYWPTANSNFEYEFPIDESILGPLTLGHRVCKTLKTNQQLSVSLWKNSVQFMNAFTEDLYQLDFPREIQDNAYKEAINSLYVFSHGFFVDIIEESKRFSSDDTHSKGDKEKIFSKLAALAPLVEVTPNDFECSDKEIEIIQDVTDTILMHSVDDPISLSHYNTHPSATIIQLQRQFGRKCFKDIAIKLKSFAYENELSKAVLMPRFWELTRLNNQMDWIPNLETCLGLAASISNLREIISTEKQRLSTMMKNSLQDLCNGPLRGVPRSLFKFWQSPRDLTLRNFFYLDQDAGVRRLRTGISDERLYEEFILGWCDVFQHSANVIIKEVERAIRIASSLLWPKYGHASFIDTESTDHEAMFLLGQFTLGYSACKHFENPELARDQEPSTENLSSKRPRKLEHSKDVAR